MFEILCLCGMDKTFTGSVTFSNIHSNPLELTLSGRMLWSLKIGKLNLLPLEGRKIV